MLFSAKHYHQALRFTSELKTELQASLQPNQNYTAPPSYNLESLDISTAYNLTNVEKVDFSGSRSNLQQNEIAYFNSLFAITDSLVIERVKNQLLLQQNKDIDLTNYNLALYKLENLNAPQNLQEPHAKIISAVKDQIQYFELLRKTKGTFNASNPYVQTSNNSLISAYQIMANTFKNEEARNIYSFEKHLCALDFI